MADTNGPQLLDKLVAQFNLKQQQAVFIEQYLLRSNGTQAAIAAGYSERTAESQASRLLRNAKVATAVEWGRKELSKATDVTREWLIGQAKEVLDSAKAEGAHTAAIGAIKEIGILSGERVEKSERDLNINTHEDRLAALHAKMNDARQPRPTTH